MRGRWRRHRRRKRHEKSKGVGAMRRGAMVWRYFAVGLAMCGGIVLTLDGVVQAQSQSLILEDFQAKEADGFPLDWLR